MWPKKCGHMAGKQVVATEDHAAKIRAAADARGERDLFIVARTDARQPLGLDAAIERCLAYARRAPTRCSSRRRSRSTSWRRSRRRCPAPLVANMIERGATPQLSRSELEQLGFALIVCPLAALFAAAKAVTDVLTELRDEETTAGALDSMLAFDELNELVGLERRYADEARYAQPDGG